MTQEVIAALVATLFPPNQPTLDQDMVNSPMDDYHVSLSSSHIEHFCTFIFIVYALVFYDIV